jgi:hypothetical protein
MTIDKLYLVGEKNIILKDIMSGSSKRFTDYKFKKSQGASFKKIY